VELRVVALGLKLGQRVGGVAGHIGNARAGLFFEFRNDLFLEQRFGGSAVCGKVEILGRRCAGDGDTHGGKGKAEWLAHGLLLGWVKREKCSLREIVILTTLVFTPSHAFNAWVR